ncbi:hypothetical protein VU04_10245 [Desulfobulbus sp. TB]|nr:hypothetical protein [Desulfobulbus sp. TB]
MSAFHLVTYAQGEPFISSQRKLGETFLSYSEERFGIQMRIHEYNQDLIKNCFFFGKIEHYKFSGTGYSSQIYLWAWKPFVILEALEKAESGDVILYCDSSRYDLRGFIESPWVLYDAVLVTQRGVLTSGYSQYLLNSQLRLFANYNAFVESTALGVKHFYSPHVVASHLLVKKSEFSESFLREWAVLCEDQKKIMASRVPDQALLNSLIQKYQLDGIDITNSISNKMMPHRELKSINFIIKAVQMVPKECAEIGPPNLDIKYLLISYFFEIIRILKTRSRQTINRAMGFLRIRPN